MEPLVNVNEAAKLLGLSSWTVRKLIANHRLQSVRINRRVLVEPSELRRIIEDGRAGTHAEAGTGATQ
jgi:excisionase family DNA binding protein